MPLDAIRHRIRQTSPHVKLVAFLFAWATIFVVGTPVILTEPDSLAATVVRQTNLAFVFAAIYVGYHADARETYAKWASLAALGGLLVSGLGMQAIGFEATQQALASPAGLVFAALVMPAAQCAIGLVGGSAVWSAVAWWRGPRSPEQIESEVLSDE